MVKFVFIYFLLTFFQNYVSSFDHFDLKTYSDPRFLNSDYHFKGLGLFHPNTDGLEKFSDFSDAIKGVNADEFFEKHGIFGENAEHENSGGFKGEGDLKDVRIESGYYYDGDGDKKEHLDGKEYYGKNHFGTEEKSDVENTEKKGHRKGHKINGFSTSHENSESGKTEEIYDEEHDVGNIEGFDGKSGEFAENEESAVKGGHKDEEFKSGEVKTGVNFDKGEAVQKVDGNVGHFGEENFGEKGETFGEKKGVDEGELNEFRKENHFVKYGPSFYY